MNLLRRKSKQKTAVPKVSNETIRDHNLPTNLSSEDLVSLNLVHARIASALSGVPDEKRCLLVFDIFFNSAHTLPSQVTLSTSILDAIKSDNTFLRLEDDLNDVVARFVPTDNLKNIAIKCTDQIASSVTTETLRIMNSIPNSASQVKSSDPTNQEWLRLSSSMHYSTLDEIVLSRDTRKQIELGLARIRYREKLQNEWNFKSVFPHYNVLLNLYGPPGTGKTMTAHAIAEELEMPILSITPSQIESKYLGESAKNLRIAFELAQNQKALIFLDEADSFLSNRIQNLSQSADQAVNSLRSEMLNQLDTFNGVAIFATNRINSYDTAYMARLFHIAFTLPGEEERSLLWQKFLLPTIPTSPDIDHLELVNQFNSVSGRDIRDAVLNAALAVLIENRNTVTQRDLILGMNARLATKSAEAIQN
ncbi:MAG: AAA family ATPase [Chloroflexota bacterium]|nr:MAG: AAA family ATPase [Chloroflexota bacterium]